MKVRLSLLGDVFDGVKMPQLVAALSALFKDIELAFNKIRIDDQIIIGGGTPILKHLSTTTTWNPPDLADGAQQTMTPDITLTGAALGDEVMVSFSLALQGTKMWGEVQSANTIRVYHRNGTGGPINLGSGTLRVSVWQH